MDIETVASALRNARPCVDLTEEESLRVAAAGTLREVAAGEALIIEGDTSHEMFVLLDGTAEVLKADPAGRQDIELGSIATGEAIGELSMLRSERRLATVRAVSTCRLFALDRPAFDALVSAGDLAAYKMALQLARVVTDRMMMMHDTTMNYLRNGNQPPHEFASFKRELMRDWDF